MKEHVNRREFLQKGTVGLTGAWMIGLGSSRLIASDEKPVRLAVIGTGGRGTGLLRTLIKHPGVKIPALCDIKQPNLDRALGIVEKELGKRPEGYLKGPYYYRRMLERDDLDGVLVTTPAVLHAEMAVDTMLAGKHVATEVPGAYTLEECWKLVDTKEKTSKRYMLCENYTYNQVRMMVMNMAHAGVFGKTFYAECSYIHDCRNLRFSSDGSLTWRGQMKVDNFGNLYPTHSLGPISKWMDINRGDRFTSLVSMMSEPLVLNKYAAKRFGKDSPQARIKFKAGDHSVTLLKTANGRLITVYYDSDSPRPASIFYLIQGTKGVYDSRRGIYIEGKSPGHSWESTGKYQKEYEHESWKKHGQIAKKAGHGGGDYFVMKDFLEMVRYDRDPWIDVYDSASWSALVELSQRSILKGGGSIEFPDFTRGKWKKV